MLGAGRQLRGSGAAVPSSAMSAFLRVFNEREEHFQLSDQIAVRFENFLGMFDTDFGSIQQFVGFTDRANGSGGKVFPLEGDDIDASWSGGEPFGEHVRRDVLQDARQSADEAVASDRGKVMDRDAAAQCRVVFNPDVTAQHDIVGGDHAVFHDAIVGDVGVGHEVALAADAGDPKILFSTSVYGYAFSEDVAVPDSDLCWRALVRQVLRIRTDDTAGKEAIVATDGGVTGEGHAVLQASAATDPHIRPDHAMMADSNVFIEFGSRIDHGGMCDDGWHISNPVSIKKSSDG